MTQQFYTLDDLIGLGLYTSVRQFYNFKKREPTSIPPYVQISERRVLFPKELLIKWVKEKMHGDAEWIEQKLAEKS